MTSQPPSLRWRPCWHHWHPRSLPLTERRHQPSSRALGDTAAGPPAICLTGPESTGKSTLATALSQHFGAALVPEAARTLLEPHQPYSESDLRQIAEAQRSAELSAREQHARVVVDTDFSVIAVWWRVRFAVSEQAPWPRWLDAQFRAAAPRCYLLCLPDLPWQPDPLRESPHTRAALALRYQGLLTGSPFPLATVAGTGNARLEAAKRALAAFEVPGW